MRLTADTITDEQINQLWRSSRSMEGNWYYIENLCRCALAPKRCIGGERRHRARAICAEILNARSDASRKDG